MGHLEKAKPDGWIVEVSDAEDAQHHTCNQFLVHITVRHTEEVASPGAMGVIYQFCPTCKTAVRVL